MIIVYIGAPLLLLISLAFWFNHKNDQKMLAEIKQTLSQYGSLNGNSYHIGDQVYQVHYFKINKQAELVINSPIIWEVYSGTSNKLINQGHLKNDTLKLVIVYPSTKPIKRYINENEMVFITHKDFFNHMHVVRLDELETFLGSEKL